jgi:hypothetical protein
MELSDVTIRAPASERGSGGGSSQRFAFTIFFVASRTIPNPLQETTFGFVLSRQGHEKGKCNDSTQRKNETIPLNVINKDIFIKPMANRCHFSHQKQGEKRGYLKFIRQKRIKCYWKLRDQIRPDVSSVEAEKTTKVAIMLAKHAIGSLFSHQQDTIRMLQTEAA